MPSPKKINKEFLDLSKTIDAKEFANSILGSFHTFIDFRRKGKILYPAWYIILGALSGYLAGCDNIISVAAWVPPCNFQTG